MGYCPKGCFGTKPHPRLSWEFITSEFFSAFEQSSLRGVERKTKKIMVKCIDKYVCGSVGGSKFWKYLLLLDAILCNILNSSACGFKKVFDQTLVLTQAIEKAHKAVNHSRNRKEEPIGKIQEVDKDWITTSHLRQTIESNIRQEAYKKDGFDIISDIFSLPPMMQYTLVDLLDLATAQIATGVRIDITLTLPIETPSQDTETITMNLNISGMTSSSKESRRNCSIGVSSSGDGSVDGESECSSEILLPSYATPPVKSVSTATEKQDICLELPHHELSYSTTSEACAIKSSVDSFKDPDIFVDNFSYDSSRNSERNDKLVFFPTTSVAPESLLIKFILEDSQFAGKKRPIQSVGKCEENVEPKTGRQLTPAEYKRSVDSSIISTLPLTNECRNKG